MPVGIVTGAQAINWYNIELRGREQHCGTTPMKMRADTLLCFAKMTVRINEIALETPGALATVAVVNSTPQSVNTIAGLVQFSIDARAKDDTTLAVLDEKIRVACQQIAEHAGVAIKTWDRYLNCPETKFDPNAVGMVKQAVKGAGYASCELQSGAGHDSVYTARKIPTAMIFIRCKAGISHNPAEYSSPEDIEAGAQVLLGAVLRYDAYCKIVSTCE